MLADAYGYSMEELRGRVLVLPLASVEEHGCLPAATDYLIAVCLASRLTGIDSVRVLPPIPYTLCPEHPACIDAGEAWRLQAYLEAVASSAAGLGAAGLILAVTHGGAFHVAYAAARTVTRRTGVRVCVVNVVEAAARGAGREGCLEHAGVLEASMLAACGVRLASGKAEEGRCLEPGPLQPWMHGDYEGLYPAAVSWSEELGEKAWRSVVREIIGAAELLLRRA